MTCIPISGLLLALVVIVIVAALFILLVMYLQGFFCPWTREYNRQKLNDLKSSKFPK